jgi:hypothetical protein
MDTSVSFKSNMFKPFLPDDSQVNPEVYGAELAFWISKKLAQKGIVTSYPENEDWGWYVEHFLGDNEYRLCCGNVEGSQTEWQCFLEPYAKGFFSRNKAPLELAKPLIDAVQQILEETDDITDIKWSSVGNT